MSGLASTALDQLKRELREIVDIERAIRVLSWDQLTYMPPGGAAGRAESLATLEGVAHARATSARLGDLISRGEDTVAGPRPRPR